MCHSLYAVAFCSLVFAITEIVFVTGETSTHRLNESQSSDDGYSDVTETTSFSRSEDWNRLTSSVTSPQGEASQNDTFHDVTGTIESSSVSTLKVHGANIKISTEAGKRNDTLEKSDEISVSTDDDITTKEYHSNSPSQERRTSETGPMSLLQIFETSKSGTEYPNDTRVSNASPESSNTSNSKERDEILETSTVSQKKSSSTVEDSTENEAFQFVSVTSQNEDVVEYNTIDTISYNTSTYGSTRTSGKKFIVNLLHD